VPTTSVSPSITRHAADLVRGFPFRAQGGEQRAGQGRRTIRLRQCNQSSGGTGFADILAEEELLQYRAKL
jgi:hypothetical protein